MTDTAAPEAGLGGCRAVGRGESRALLAVLAADPLVSAPAAEKFASSGVAAGADGRFLTLGGPERSLVFVGSSVLPLRGDAADQRALGDAVARLGLGPMSVHGRRDLVAGMSVVFWAFATWLIPVLVAAGVWRHFLRGIPLVYQPTLWSMVFPLGMYAVAGIYLGRADRLPVVQLIGESWFWVALLAWVLVAMGMARDVWRALTRG